MPERRGRSRKRKAAARAADNGTDKEPQPEKDVAGKEDRYVPRFGSVKRPRIASSSSQPAARISGKNDKIAQSSDTTGSDGLAAERQTTVQCDEDASESPSATARISVSEPESPVEGRHGGAVGSDAADGLEVNTDLVSREGDGDLQAVVISEEEEEEGEASHVHSSQLQLTAAVNYVHVKSTAAIPGMSLSQFPPPLHYSHSSSSFRLSSEDSSACSKEHSPNDATSDKGRFGEPSSPCVLSSSSLLTTPAVLAHPGEPLIGASLSSVPVAAFREEATAKAPAEEEAECAGGGMNLELLNLMEPDSKESGKHPDQTDEGLGDSQAHKQENIVMNIHEANGDTDLIHTHSASDEINITHSTIQPANTATSTSTSCITGIGNGSSSHGQNTTPMSFQNESTSTLRLSATPIDPPVTDLTSPQLLSSRLAVTPFPNASLENSAREVAQSLYEDGSHTDAKSTAYPNAVSEVQGMEDMVVVGGDDGQLQLMSSSLLSDQTKNEVHVYTYIYIYIHHT